MKGILALCALMLGICDCTIRTEPSDSTGCRESSFVVSMASMACAVGQTIEVSGGRVICRCAVAGDGGVSR